MTEIRLCEECKHYKMDARKEPCRYCLSTLNKPNWEPKEKPFTGRSLEDCVTCKYSSHNNGTGIACNEICNTKIDGYEPVQKRQCDACKYQIPDGFTCKKDRTQVGENGGVYDHDPCEYEPARKSCKKCKYEGTDNKYLPCVKCMDHDKYEIKTLIRTDKCKKCEWNHVFDYNLPCRDCINEDKYIKNHDLIKKSCRTCGWNNHGLCEASDANDCPDKDWRSWRPLSEQEEYFFDTPRQQKFFEWCDKCMFHESEDRLCYYYHKPFAMTAGYENFMRYKRGIPACFKEKKKNGKSCHNCKYSHEYTGNSDKIACMSRATKCGIYETKKKYLEWEFTDKPCNTCKHSYLNNGHGNECEKSFKMTPARECWEPKKEREITWSLEELNDFKTYCFACKWYEKDLFGTDRMYCTLATMPAYQVFIKNDKKCPFDHGKIACKTCKNSSINNETGEHCDKTWKEEAEFRKCWEPVQKKFCFGCKHEGTLTSQEPCNDCYGDGTHGRPKWEAEDPSKTCDNCENGPNQDSDDCGACFKQSIWKPKNQEMTPTLLGDDIMSQKRMEEENKIHKELLESFIEHSQSKFETTMEMVSDAVNKPEYKGGLIGTDNANKLRDIRKTLEDVMNINKLQALIKNFKKNKKEGGDEMPEKDIKEQITELEEKINKEKATREKILKNTWSYQVIFTDIRKTTKKGSKFNKYYSIKTNIIDYCGFSKKMEKTLKQIQFNCDDYLHFTIATLNGENLTSQKIKWNLWNQIKLCLEQIPEKYDQYKKRELTREYCRLTKDCMKPTKKNECHMCGKKNRKDASFCCQCGYKMGGND